MRFGRTAPPRGRLPRPCAGHGYAPRAPACCGDYYFSADRAAAARLQQRLSRHGGLLIAPAGRRRCRTCAWQSARGTSLAAPQRLRTRRPTGPAPCPTSASATATSRLKRAGASAADIGLVVQSPGNALRLGRGCRRRSASRTWCATCAWRRAAARRVLLVLTRARRGAIAGRARAGGALPYKPDA